MWLRDERYCYELSLVMLAVYLPQKVSDISEGKSYARSYVCKNKQCASCLTLLSRYH